MNYPRPLSELVRRLPAAELPGLIARLDLDSLRQLAELYGIHDCDRRDKDPSTCIMLWLPEAEMCAECRRTLDQRWFLPLDAQQALRRRLDRPAPWWHKGRA